MSPKVKGDSIWSTEIILIFNNYFMVKLLGIKYVLRTNIMI